MHARNFEVIRESAIPELNNSYKLLEAYARATKPEEVWNLWTPIVGLDDFPNISRNSVRAAHDVCEAFGSVDLQFRKRDVIPEDIYSYLNIPYCDDDLREHELDVYVPLEALQSGFSPNSRTQNTFPVFVDIHGGGYAYGYIVIFVCR